MRAVPLDWNALPCATSYKVIVRVGSKPGTKADSKTVNVSNDTTKKLTKNTTYWWQVSACNPHGCTKSAARTFTVTKKATLNLEPDGRATAILPEWILGLAAWARQLTSF